MQPLDRASCADGTSVALYEIVPNLRLYLAPDEDLPESEYLEAFDEPLDEHPKSVRDAIEFVKRHLRDALFQGERGNSTHYVLENAYGKALMDEHLASVAEKLVRSML